MMHRRDAVVNPAGLDNTGTGDSAMFGYSSITRQIQKWRVERERIAIENMLYELPLELQKDIGWPAARARSQGTDRRLPCRRVQPGCNRGLMSQVKIFRCRARDKARNLWPDRDMGP
jgi:hypothetical protein